MPRPRSRFGECAARRLRRDLRGARELAADPYPAARCAAVFALARLRPSDPASSALIEKAPKRRSRCRRRNASAAASAIRVSDRKDLWTPHAAPRLSHRMGETPGTVEVSGPYERKNGELNGCGKAGRAGRAGDVDGTEQPRKIGRRQNAGRAARSRFVTHADHGAGARDQFQSKKRSFKPSKPPAIRRIPDTFRACPAFAWDAS